MSQGKCILYIATSLDMYIAREDGSIDWLLPAEDYGYEAFYQAIDATLMGNLTFQQVLGFGAFPYEKTQNFVFSRKKQASTISEVEIVHQDPVQFTREVVLGQFSKVWLIGGAQIIHLFFQADLIDEMRLFVHPNLLGKGIPLFPTSHTAENWTLLASQSFDTGVIELHYQRASR